MRIGVVSGGFDPLHAGHVAMMQEARSLCDHLLVLLNSDDWLLRKKGYVSVPYEQRAEVVRTLRCVDAVAIALDDDDTVVKSLRVLRHQAGAGDTVIFMNGGDRGRDNVPEAVVEGVEFLFGVGGESKMNSSSLINPSGYLARVDRAWGFYEDHFRTGRCVFKTLHLRTGQGTSLQRHQYRSEVWFVDWGEVLVEIAGRTEVLSVGGSTTVPAKSWHRITALRGPAVVREMQFGELCDESDIERSK
jgi:cytidyltransferase-like protein